MSYLNTNEEKILKRLGKFISTERKRKKYSQAELAEQCDIDLTTVWRIEAGIINTKAFTLLKILKALEIKNIDFIYEKEEI